MRVNPKMTALCRATSCLSTIVLDSHRNFIDVLILCGSLSRFSGFLFPGSPANTRFETFYFAF
jgi:hypothetical protein